MVRATQAFDADHMRASAQPGDLSSQASVVQSSPAEAIRESTFLGPVDSLSSDSELFENIQDTLVGSPTSLVPSAPPEPRQPLSEGEQPAGFSGQNFVEFVEPVSGELPRLSARDVQKSSRRGEQEGILIDGVPQISGVKSPEKPFYMGLVDVPGVGYMNTIFSRNPSGEFDPTREATDALLVQPLLQPDTSQPRSLTPAVVRLNVNPKDIVLTYSKKVSAQRVRGNYFRREIASVTGFTVEHHWDELDVVSLNCTTGNFWVNGGLHYPRGETAGRIGFRSASRSKSLAYRKLQAVMAMFRNNGCGWLTGASTMPNKAAAEFFGKDFNIVVNPGSAFMMYDNIIWYGNFETMKVNERGDNPNAFDFSIDFKVARTVDLNGVSEADVLVGAERGGESFFTDTPQSGRQLATGSVEDELLETQASVEIRQALEQERREIAAELILPDGEEGPPLSQTQIDRISTEQAAASVVSKGQGG